MFKMTPSTVVWTPGMLDAYKSLVSKLCNFCLLTIPLHTYTLHTDASVLVLGAVLNVSRDDGKEKPVAFFSRQLRCAEKRYSATELQLWQLLTIFYHICMALAKLEALAVLKSVNHFSHWLRGCSFTVITDHSPLTSLMSNRSLRRRLQSWALQLEDFSFNILYRSWKDNGEASRQEWT